ncbi:amidohydrolase family protein [Kordiimonas gwangyangensis]|uniref:amidohydrolase family protein n=1 Tax=Kordiimonas gwangyangensis TaxID=288022 RepID=UPI00046FBE4F|nr:amidohydrolase family protein [Kordiimonas gwangyangensis]
MRMIASLLISMFVTLECNSDILIKNVTVLSMGEGGATENAAVHISGDRIVAVRSDAAPLPATSDLTVIDGTGKFLIPGMTEMHGHLPPASWSTERAEDTLFLYVAGGVTTVRGMLGDAAQFAMRDSINAGDIVGPMLYLAAPSLNGNSVSSVEEARAKTTRYASEGWDLQKIHPGLSRDEYDAMAETANALNYPFGGHVPADVGIEHALEAGQISIDHMDGYIEWLDGESHELSADALARAVAITRPSGTWIVPTQALFNTFYSGYGAGDALSDAEIDALLSREENAYVPAETRAQWAKTAQNARPNALVIKNRQMLLKAFADAGLNLAMGSDAPQTFSVPGFSIWREIEVMVDAGLTPEQILEIGTAAPGRYFADKDRFGVIETGARADLILLDADPRLDALNLTKQAGVMAAGRWYSHADIDKRLVEIAERNKD